MSKMVIITLPGLYVLAFLRTACDVGVVERVV